MTCEANRTTLLAKGVFAVRILAGMPALQDVGQTFGRAPRAQSISENAPKTSPGQERWSSGDSIRNYSHVKRITCRGRDARFRAPPARIRT